MSVSFVCVACFQVEVSASGRSLVQRSPTECGVSEYDSVASIMRRPWPIRSFGAIKKSFTNAVTTYAPKALTCFRYNFND